MMRTKRSREIVENDEVELREGMDPDARAIYVGGKFLGHLLWHDGEWRVTVHDDGPITSIPWKVIEAVARFKAEETGKPQESICHWCKKMKPKSHPPNCGRNPWR